MVTASSVRKVVARVTMAVCVVRGETKENDGGRRCDLSL